MDRRQRITVYLSDESSRTLDDLAQRLGHSRERTAQDVLARALAVKRFRQLREQMRPYAEAAGFQSDQDVFDAVS